MLNRLPRHMPPFTAMLADIGSPSVKEIARALQVKETTVRKWLREDQAPHPVMLAVFWITRWGVSAIDCEAHNAAILQAGLARSRQDQIESLESRIQRLAQIASFGSANDPAPGVVPLAAIQNPDSTGDQTGAATELQPAVLRVGKTGSTPATMRVTSGFIENRRAKTDAVQVQKKTN